MGNCVVGSCVFRWYVRAQASEFGVGCLFAVCVCLEISKKLRSRIHLLPFSDFQDVYFDSSFERKLGIKLRSSCCCYGSSKKI